MTEIEIEEQAATIARLTAPLEDDRRVIYVASRASIPERPAMWLRMRALGWPIISSWIDESGPGQTTSMRDLWARINAEISVSSLLILYAKKSDLPLKGAYVEVGIALALGIPVLAVADCELGSWTNHPLVRVQRNMPTLAEVTELLKRPIRRLRAGEDTRLLDRAERTVSDCYRFPKSSSSTGFIYVCFDSNAQEHRAETLRDALRAAIAAEGEKS